MPLAIVLLVVGLAFLTKGADWLVDGARAVALRLGVSPLVVGLTVVAFGTSAPELAASIGATLKGVGEMAVGNAVGSNIANVCLILGLVALVKPIPCRSEVVKRDAPIMIGITGFSMLALLGGMISRVEGIALVGGIVAYSLFNYVAGTREAAREGAGEGEPGGAEMDAPMSMARAWLWLVLGVVLLTVGAEALVRGAETIARALGVPEVVIGLTIVAFGTSVPELFTSLRAAGRGQADIGVGNILGSNVFNLLSVLGITALVSPVPVPEQVVRQDMWVMLGAALACLPIMWGGRIARAEGAVLLLAYLVYTGLLFVRALG